MAGEADQKISAWFVAWYSRVPNHDRTKSWSVLLDMGRRKRVNGTTIKVLDAIIAYKREHDGNSPTYAMIRKLAGVARATAFQQVLNLISVGKLRKNEFNQLEVVDGVWEFTGTYPQMLQSASSPDSQ